MSCDYLEDTIARLTDENDRLRELLREWDSLIEYQYSGSREAMGAMTVVAQKTAAALEDQPQDEDCTCDGFHTGECKKEVDVRTKPA